MTTMTNPYPKLPPLIQCQDVWKTYENGKIEVLKNVSFEVGRGELIALCGTSGCGKSTLLHLLAGLDLPDRGQVLFDGESLRGGRRLLQHLRHTIGYIFQLHNLIPDLSLAENCLIPALGAGVPRKEAMDRLTELTSQLGLSDRLQSRIQELSGGERQRTAICRALINRPKVILADEPTGSLDDINRLQVFDMLLTMVRRQNATLILATHDRDLAERCDRLMVVKATQLHINSSARGHA